MNLIEIINGIRNEIYKAESLTPDRAAELLVTLSALNGNVNDREVECEMIYNKKLSDLLMSEGKAAQAAIIAKTTQEYEDLKKMLALEKTTTEMMRSLKRFLDNKRDEYGGAKYQH